MHKPISTKHSMDPFPSFIAQQISLSYRAHVLLEAKQTQSKHHPYCAVVQGICSMACIAIEFAQNQDPNLSCPDVASTQPPLIPNEIAYIQPQIQCQLFAAPNASSHLISFRFIHIGNSIFLCSLAIYPSLSFRGYHKPSTIKSRYSSIKTILL